MKKDTVKIAVYGSLKRGFYNHRLIAGSMLNCQQCTIKGKLYDTGNGYPAFTASAEGYSVTAELMTLDARILPVVDHLEGHPRFYTRVLIDCTLADGKTEQAYVYIMSEHKTRRMIEITGGNWK